MVREVPQQLPGCEHSDITLSSKQLNADGKLTASVTVTNTGNYDADEIVQLYIRDLVGSITRPVKELKCFERIHLKKGESKQVTFTITPELLKFYNYNLDFVCESGDFEVMIGRNSQDVKKAAFKLLRHTVCIRTRRVPCNDWTQQPRCKDYEF